MVASSQRALAFSLSFGLVSGEARGTHDGCCISCWFAKGRRVLVDGPRRWIPSVGAFSWANSVSVVVYPGRWVVAMGRWAILWVFRWFCGRFHGLLAIIRGLRMREGVDVWAVVVFDVAQGGPVLVGFEARCAWSG